MAGERGRFDKGRGDVTIKEKSVYVTLTFPNEEAAQECFTRISESFRLGTSFTITPAKEGN